MNARNVTSSLAVLTVALSCLCLSQARAGSIFTDNFETYPVQSPAPNPLTNGPAGGQWWFADPTPPTIGANEHRIYISGTGGSALQSRCWISNTDQAGITNAITIPALPTGSSTHTFTLSFLAATDTTQDRPATFRYDIASSGGVLTFVSGNNLDVSQQFNALSGYGIAATGAKGKTDDRKFQVVFTATGITTADKIFLSLSRITNSGAAGAFIALDDVSLELNFGAPVVVTQPASATVEAGSSHTFSAVVTNFPSVYQWSKDGADIPGATTSSYTIPFVTKADEGSYVLWASSSEGAVYTTPAILTVTDVVKPAITSASALLTMEHIQIRFSEPLQVESVTPVGNYTLTGGATVNEAVLADASTVELLTSALTPGTSYTVTVSGVQDLGGNAITPASTIAVTVPALVISAVRYNAGTPSTHPQGAPDPASAAGGYWSHTANTNVGMAVGSVLDDMGSGLNAWMVSDQNVSSTGSIMDYRMPIDNPSDALAQTNGWRFLVHSRMVTDFFGGNASPVILYGDSSRGRRYGLVLDLDANNELTASLLGGATYVLTNDSTSYHTHVLIFDPATTNASYYFDGRAIVRDYAGQANTAYNGVVMGTGSSGGSGEMNFNRVQFDVVGGTAPVVVAHPESSVNGVGQKVTFTAEFTPFVGAYQWLLNGTVSPGAVGNSFTTDFVTLGMNGDQYVCRALHALGNVETQPATLTVTSDTEPPVIVSVEGSLLLDRVRIVFSEPVLSIYATNIANYAWVNPGIVTLSARMADPLTVELRTSPQSANSNYTVQVSNIRDTSNLPIASGTPASFTTAKLNLVARYDAGTTTSRPAGPPSPESPEGGNWVVNNGTDAGLITNAVMDDLGSGFHAWQVTDQTTAASQFIQYNLPLTPEQQAVLTSNPWVMTIRSRFSEDFASSFAVMSQFGTAAGNRFLLWFDVNETLDLTLRPQGAADLVLTSGSVGTAAYHLHQVVYNPATTNADYYFDGERILTGWAGDVSVFAYSGIQWGTGSSANQGSMNFNLVEFKAVEPPVNPVVSASLNGPNVEVSYIGVLETATAIAGQITWTPVATNAQPVAAIYSVPATAASQIFFRSRTAQ